MTDMIAIISKTVFENLPGSPEPGDVVPLDGYDSKTKALKKLGATGRLFLVTVRPDERLWLVCVLSGLEFTGQRWRATKSNRTPIVDVTGLRGEIRFSSGKGISQETGKLGMSLQTPRELAESDVGLLLEACDTQRVKDAVAFPKSRLPDFDSCSPSSEWAGQETELERSFEGWIETIARTDPAAGVLAACVCAEYAFPIAKRHAEASDLDFGAPDQSWGGAVPPDEQVARVRAWITDGTPIPHHTADYARQQNVWDEDMRPMADYPSDWFVYCVEASNLLVMAVLHDDQGGPYGKWPGTICAARSAVCSYKAMYGPGGDRQTDLITLRLEVEKAL